MCCPDQLLYVDGVVARMAPGGRGNPVCCPDQLLLGAGMVAASLYYRVLPDHHPLPT